MDKKFRSQAQIADFLGIPRRTLSSYCTGHRRIGNLDTRKKLLELTGIEFFKSDTPDIQEVNALNEWMNSVIDRSMRNKRDIDDLKEDASDDSNTDDMKDIDDGSDTDDKNSADDANNGSRPFLDMMSELRNWFNNQDRWSTKKEFADDIGIPRSTMKKIFLGVRWPKEEYRQKLYEITGLECFKDINQKANVVQDTDMILNMETGIKIDQEKKLIDVGQQEQTEQMTEESKLPEESKLLIERVERRNDKPDNLKESVVKHILVGHGDEVDKLAKAFYSLARALEPFKHGTPEQREKVKNRIPAEDLGYIISFMKAMYDEDHFTDFMFFSEYRLKGGNGDKK